MIRVSKRERCPVCGRDGWCGCAEDGSFVICMREESPYPTANGGWLHRLREGSPRRTHAFVERLPPPPPDYTEDTRKRIGQAPRKLLQSLAGQLGLPVDVLARMGVHWRFDAGAFGAFGFPMVDPRTRRVTGIRLRDFSGCKWSVKGSRDGLFLTVKLDPDPLLICEGPTDTAAALALGFAAVGRPSCRGTIPLLTYIARKRAVAVFADSDKPGTDGGRELAQVLALHATSVRLVHPPNGIKDLREWYRAGATKADVEALIAAAAPFRLTFRGEDIA